MSLLPNGQIDGIQYHTRPYIRGLDSRTAKPPANNGNSFTIIEVYYNNNFLDYIFEPQNFKGPNGEAFIATKQNLRSALDVNHMPAGNHDDTNWEWYITLEDATKALIEREFTDRV